ncbi:MAG: MmcQ/YjbR family DNA-binding protein [Proteobacteria bacterium]|nr:MmcQ/YjbR family DNA-binding protein [Pseudomonadota bacterium]
MSLSNAQMKKIVLSFALAEEGKSYGYPSFKVNGKFFTRLRDEDNSLVLTVGSIDERDLLLQANPRLFHITDHYKNYPAVLARMEKLDAKTFKHMLEQHWRTLVPKKLLASQTAQKKEKKGSRGVAETQR